MDRQLGTARHLLAYLARRVHSAQRTDWIIRVVNMSNNNLKLKAVRPADLDRTSSVEQRIGSPSVGNLRCMDAGSENWRQLRGSKRVACLSGTCRMHTAYALHTYMDCSAGDSSGKPLILTQSKSVGNRIEQWKGAMQDAVLQGGAKGCRSWYYL